jgi:hypothetical protein
MFAPATIWGGAMVMGMVVGTQAAPPERLLAPT